DVIVKEAAGPIRSIERLVDLIATKKPGDKIDLEVVRGASRIQVNVKLGRQPWLNAAPTGPVPLGAGFRRSRRPARRAEAQSERPTRLPGPLAFFLHAVPGFSLARPYI